MKEIEIICGSYGQDIVLGVPFCMQDLAVEVQTLHTDFILSLSPCRGHSLVAENSSQSGHISRRLITILTVRLPVKYPEEIVVCTSYDFTENRRSQGIDNIHTV